MRDLIGALPLSIPTLARALDRSPDCVKLLDLEGRLVWMNTNGLCAMEIDNFDAVAGKKWPELWPAASAETVNASLSQSVTEGIATFSGFCPTAKGAKRWWDVTVHAAADESGRTVGYLSISRDVTDRESQIAAMEAVGAEMRHRPGLIAKIDRATGTVLYFPTPSQNINSSYGQSDKIAFAATAWKDFLKNYR